MGFFSKKDNVIEEDNIESWKKIVEINIKPKEPLKIHEHLTLKYTYPESAVSLLEFRDAFIDFLIEKDFEKEEQELSKKEKEDKYEQLKDFYQKNFEIVSLYKDRISLAFHDISILNKIRINFLKFVKTYVDNENIQILQRYYQALADAGFNVQEDYLNDIDKIKAISDAISELTNNPNDAQKKWFNNTIAKILKQPIELITNFSVWYIYLPFRFFKDLKKQIKEIYENEKEIMEKIWSTHWIDQYLEEIKNKFIGDDYNEKEMIEEAARFVDVVLNILVKRYGASDIFFLPYSGTDRPTGRILYKALGKAKLFIDDIPGDFFLRMSKIIWLKAGFEIKDDQYQYSGIIQSFPIDAMKRVNFRTETFQVLSKTHLGWPMPFTVLRTLEGGKSKTLEELNYTEEFINAIRILTRNNKQGIIIVSWPTGSGKSTLLYSVISEYSIQMSDRLIYSIENPVEKDLNLWNFAQMEIDPAKGMEFKIGLKSLMRMAPDVIFVWEIRDKETALAALEAANTWHLVFATLHVNNSIEIFWRLAWLIWEENEDKLEELKTSLKGAIAQRLVPLLCEKCMQEEEWEMLIEDLKKIKGVDYSEELSEIDKVYITGSGCNYCKGMWTVWRLPVVEIISYNKVIKSNKELYRYLKWTINFKSMFWYAIEQLQRWFKIDYKSIIDLYDPVTDIKNIDLETIKD